MEIVKQPQNCKFDTKDIVLIFSIVHVITAISICKKGDKIYE